MSADTVDEEALAAVCGHCAGLPGATLDHTFGEDSDVYRVGNKMFALVNTEGRGFATLKAPPEEVRALLEQHEFARPGYYMNKRHWVTLDLVEGVPVGEVLELVGESYRLVLEALPKKAQAEIRSA
ncbi:putative DNA-binding protein (MmcQ/YjbR family) [Arthrobacter sp. CAN_A212]|uniref:MmcQ/YjbR family DNA-binding protein n=1 Tax=Arthrobacter sp. CAN_A212 TaxID=2787719 RepID=UPI0018C8EE58